MIMAGYRWQGELPFRNVFFTSIIRDRKGRKLSKSLGNSPDPLDLIDQFGADGVRFGLMRIAPTGTDVRYDEDQIVEGRNFANKLWNAARYRQMQGAITERQLPVDDLSIYAIDILAKLEKLESDLVDAYDDYRFNELTQLLYDFWWSEYCDWYLESTKGDFSDTASESQRQATLTTMDVVLERFLMLLHPVMPHLTEELWEKMGFGDDETFLMLTPVPKTSVLAEIPAARVKSAQEQVSNVYEAVGRARNLKAEYGLGAKKDVSFILDPIDGEFSEAEVFLTLARGAELIIQPDFQAEKGVPAALTAIGKLFLPLDGLIDVDAERERLQKELTKTEAEVKKVNAKLANENFVSRAPEAVIAETKERQQHWQDRAAELEQMIANLG